MPTPAEQERKNRQVINFIKYGSLITLIFIAWLRGNAIRTEEDQGRYNRPEPTPSILHTEGRNGVIYQRMPQNRT